MICNMPSVLYQNRFCSQENFDIIASGILCNKKTYNSKKLVKLSLQIYRIHRTDTILTYENYTYSSVVTHSDVYTFCYKDDSKVLEYVGANSEKHKYAKLVVLPESGSAQLARSFMEYLFVYT